jgi:hypothetical protein
VCVRLEGDGPMVKELVFVALACSGPRHSPWHVVGDDSAVLEWLLSAPLPICGGGAVSFVCVVVGWCSL